jgi:dTDP-4-dehydrorhamnose reductase
MRIIILGASGQVGYELSKIFNSFNRYAIMSLSSEDLDITNHTAVEECISTFKPNILINAAAYTKVDDCESNKTIAEKVNYKAVANLVKHCNKNNTKIFHFSTDYVFDGKSTKPYSEEDATNPINEYGKSKLCGDQFILKNASKFNIFRVSWVFGSTGHNFVRTMLNNAHKSEISIVDDQFGCPTSAKSIAKIVKVFIDNYSSHNGLFNFTNSPPVSWHEFASNIFNFAYEAGQITSIPQLVKVNTSQFKTKARRPANSVLSISKIEKLLGKNIIPAWKHELRDVISEID